MCVCKECTWCVCVCVCVDSDVLMMAVSRYAYVKGFEQEAKCLPETWIVIDVGGAHRFSEDYIFTEPSDENAIRLMNQCAEGIMRKYLDIILAYGQGDEFTFVFKRSTTLFNRRPSKIVSNVLSDFSAFYFSYWQDLFPSIELQYLPSFDGQILTFPNPKAIQDYLSWKQETDKNNKKDSPQIFRKGNCLIWASSPTGRKVVVTHEDLTGESFWTEFWKNHPDILQSTRSGQVASVKIPMYTKKFRHEAKCLPETWIVLHLDGQSFHRFSEDHNFTKPCDEDALRLMNQCAESVIYKFSDILLAYGHSDKYAFVFGRSTNLFERKPSIITSSVAAYFAVCYAFHWSSFFPTTQLQYPPSFDGLLMTFPELGAIQGYLKEKQMDCHVSSLYSTSLWALVHSGETLEEAEKRLCGTDEKDKREILFTLQSINYDTLPQIFRKGSCLIPSPSGGKVVVTHEDMAEESFWTKHLVVTDSTEHSNFLEDTMKTRLILPHSVYKQEDTCLPETWMVLCLDGQGFHKFSEDHKFTKPNDENALRLMNQCAESVVSKFSEIVLAYGQSDEYSFVFRRDATLFERKLSKIMTSVVSHFTVCYLSYWSSYFPATQLQYPPLFVGEMMTFPNLRTVKDYLCWRQGECHTHNLYSTSLWALVHSGMTLEAAEKRLHKTDKKDKNELLFSQFSINYNTLPQIFRKGSCLVRDLSTTGRMVIVTHEDLKVESFWARYPDILADTRSRPIDSPSESFSTFCCEDKCLPGTWMVLRLDGRCFHKFSEDHKFTKPNDENALRLMNQCAECVVSKFSDIVLAYGQSDEYSFVFRRDTMLFERRPGKIMTSVVSHFTVCYISHWSSYFPTTQLQYPPSFDGRVVSYPNLRTIRDYLSWRQVDCHINNLYNTSFWALVHSRMTLKDAEKMLCGTDKNDKKELLLKHSISYDTLPQIFRKGSCLIWASSSTAGRKVVVTHEDIIGESFWIRHPEILVST